MLVKDELNGLTEEEIFSILAHPLRRQILKSIFENGYTTFSNIRQDNKVSTGTIYHHLDGMSLVLEQDDKSQYLLNEKGKNLCIRYLDTERGKVTIQKFERLSDWSVQISDFVKNKRNILTTISLLLFLLISLVSYKFHILAIGPIFVNYEAESKIFLHITLFVLVQVLYFLLFLIIYWLYSVHRASIPVKLIIANTFVGLLPANILLATVIILNHTGVVISPITWVIISLLSQIGFHIITFAMAIHNYNYTPERSISFSIIPVYVSMGIVFIF